MPQFPYSIAHMHDWSAKNLQSQVNELLTSLALLIIDACDEYIQAENDFPPVWMYCSILGNFQRQEHILMLFPKKINVIKLMEEFVYWERMYTRSQIIFQDNSVIETGIKNGILPLTIEEIPSQIEWEQGEEKVITIACFCAAEFKKAKENLYRPFRVLLEKFADPKLAMSLFKRVLRNDILAKAIMTGALLKKELGQSHVPNELVALKRESDLAQDEFRKQMLKKGKNIPSKAETEYRKYTELKCITSGMIKLATVKKFQWRMVTLTPPKEFYTHKPYQTSVYNPKHEAAEFLQSKWESLCKDLPRLGLLMSEGAVFGFRVAEAHKDSTPHWHVILYYPQGQLGKLKSLFKKHYSESKYVPYFSKSISPNINLPQISPITVDVKLAERVEPNNPQAATNYLLKYLGPDRTPLSSNGDYCESEKAKAWTQTLRLRQYQLFGLGHSVKMWREIRKLCNKLIPIKKATLNLLDFERICLGKSEQSGHELRGAKLPKISTMDAYRIAAYAVSANFADFYIAIKDVEFTFICMKNKTATVGIKFSDGALI
jgi:hypothetical protein